MRKITLEIADELAERLKPYQDELARILQIGLQQVEASEPAPAETSRELGIRILKEHDVARPLDERIVRKYVPDLEHHVRSTPLVAAGRPASEIIIDERGPRE